MTDIVKWSAEIQSFMYSDMDFPGGLNKKSRRQTLCCVCLPALKEEVLLFIFFQLFWNLMSQNGCTGNHNALHQGFGCKSHFYP